MDLESLGGYIFVAAFFFALGHLIALHPSWVPAIAAKLRGAFRKKPPAAPAAPEPQPFSIGAPPELLAPAPPEAKPRPAWVKEQ